MDVKQEKKKTTDSVHTGEMVTNNNILKTVISNKCYLKYILHVINNYYFYELSYVHYCLVSVLTKAAFI